MIVADKPYRIRHSHTQHIQAAADTVFPLLCPVREAEWIPGWMPSNVFTVSGVAEQDSVFETEVEGRTATWLITRHEPDTGQVDMVQFIPGLVVIQLWIEVEADTAHTSMCHITYQYTAVSAEGREFVDSRNADWYETVFMAEWESLMNAFVTA